MKQVQSNYVFQIAFWILDEWITFNHVFFRYDSNIVNSDIQSTIYIYILVSTNIVSFLASSDFHL